MATNCSIPVIDPNVRHVGVSKLRELNASKLRDTKEETLVIQENDNPLAVLLSYERYLIIQDQLMAVYNTLDILMNEKERRSLFAGLNDVQEGRTRSLAEIEAEMEGK